MRTGYPVVVAMLLVVTSFAVSLAYSQYLVQQIDERAMGIISDRVPRFEHLAGAQRAQLQLAAFVDEQIAGAGTDAMDARAEAEALLSKIHRELDAYDAPTPGERADLAAIRENIAQLETATRAALQRVDTGPDKAAALMAFVRQVRPLEIDTTRRFDYLRGVNVDRVKSDTQRILSMRRSAVQAATALGLLSLALAIAATALVLQGQYARVRLMEERDRLLTERAAELESFAGRVAHDLRDPLNAARLRLTVLERTPGLDLTVRGQLDRVSHQLDRTRRVIDGLLEFARSGARPLPGARADLGLVLDEVLSTVRPAAEAAHAELRVGPITDVSLAVAPEALGSVLSNLLGNAVKYVGEGEELPHRIGVRASRRAGLARIEIEDNGPGLPPGTEQRVFEPFRRFASRQPGTGLGLATVKRIVEAYQGRVGVVAEPGHGSTFWVEIPCCDAPVTARREPAREI